MVEMVSTIGYGVMTPKSLYANIVMTAETYTGLGMVAIATGLIFSRVSRPTARVMFSRIAVVTPFDGVTTAMRLNITRAVGRDTREKIRPVAMATMPRPV